MKERYEVPCGTCPTWCAAPAPSPEILGGDAGWESSVGAKSTPRCELSIATARDFPERAHAGPGASDRRAGSRRSGRARVSLDVGLEYLSLSWRRPRCPAVRHNVYPAGHPDRLRPAGCSTCSTPEPSTAAPARQPSSYRNPLTRLRDLGTSLISRRARYNHRACGLDRRLSWPGGARSRWPHRAIAGPTMNCYANKDPITGAYTRPAGKALRYRRFAPPTVNSPSSAPASTTWKADRCVFSRCVLASVTGVSGSGKSTLSTTSCRGAGQPPQRRPAGPCRAQSGSPG